jgi:UDP-3-O-[3-hydroxymyristoyl] glucosamine N-acyltransferase
MTKKEIITVQGTEDAHQKDGNISLTELEKCMSGEWYDCHNEIFMAFKSKAQKLLSRYNSLAYDDKVEKHSILQDLFGDSGVIILPGVTICSGAVIGAGSVVAKNIPRNSVAFGNPCKVMRKINSDLEQLNRVAIAQMKSLVDNQNLTKRLK